jgi:mannan endo-1,4-beta-mannosidase
MKHRRGETLDAARPSATHHLPRPIVIVGAVLLVLIAVIVAVARDLGSSAPRAQAIMLPAKPRSYLGLYERSTISSYTAVNQFAHAIGRQPNLVSSYIGWGESFQTGFAARAAQHGAVPLVQIDPENISLSAIASGRYDPYLRGFASAVRTYQHPVVIGFGHEMNASWYSWGYRHASPAAFVAAWRHIVTVFRAQGAWNVTWLWTVNVVGQQQAQPVRSPGPWWPGSSYVTWVGIDGYYFVRSWTFAPLFGPTIKAVHALTHDPILVSETAAGTTDDQPAKIANLFAGIRAYGLLGFVWFNVNKEQDWVVTGPAALAAFRQGARAYHPLRP